MTSPLYLVSDSHRFNRRSFLLATSSLAAAALWSSRAFGAVQQNIKFPSYPFQLGVASGDPTPTGVVLWTRLAPRPLEDGGMPPEPVEVAWQVSEDEGMTKVVQKGTTIANPDWAHSVHVEVNGLRPDRWYWYQFKAGTEISPKGRTRTMPPAHSMPDRLRFAFASCQHYEMGYFTAYQHMAKEDLDLVFHLGDYIYEGAGQADRVRRHPGKEIISLDDYRVRHSLYRLDPALQAAHAAFPWVVTWDDHEVDNNYANMISERPKDWPLEFLKRRAAAYKAYYEHMPLRRGSLPHGPDMQLYRQLDFGRLAQFFVLDTRQYRTDQPCGDGNKPPCPEVFDPKATLMGETQKKWLFNGLSSSPAKWNVLAQQVMMARVDRTAGEVASYSMDQWPGYETERRQVIRHFRDRKIANPVVLTGDIHSNWVNELATDFDNSEAPPVGAEFVGTSITSGGDGTKTPKNLDALYSENPCVRYHNQERGYVRCQLDKSEWKTDYQLVEYVSRKDAPSVTRATFVLEAGQSRIHAA